MWKVSLGGWCKVSLYTYRLARSSSLEAAAAGADSDDRVRSKSVSTKEFCLTDHWRLLQPQNVVHMSVNIMSALPTIKLLRQAWTSSKYICSCCGHVSTSVQLVRIGTTSCRMIQVVSPRRSNQLLQIS